MDPLNTQKAVVTELSAFNALTAATFGANAERTLRHEEEILWDKELVTVARQRLTAFSDMQAAGVIKSLGGLGDILSAYERVGDGTRAKVDLSGVTPGQDDILTFDEVFVPIPIVHKDFIYDHRQMESSRKLGQTLSTTGIEVATRLVMDEVDEIIFNGLVNEKGENIILGGHPLYGYTTHPDRVVMDINDWLLIIASSDADMANQLIVADVNNMLKQMYAKSRYGPFTLYVANDLWAAIDLDYSDQKGDNTIKQRIEALSGISKVRPGDNLEDGSISLVGLQKENVDYAVAQDIVQVQWSTNPFQTRYKVWCAGAPRLKADRNGSLAIGHGVKKTT